MDDMVEEGDTAKGGAGSGRDEAASDCRDTIKRLYHYLDGELTEDRRRAIQRHLDECSPCLEAFDFEADLRSVVASRCRDTVPEGLRERVASALLREQGSTG